MGGAIGAMERTKAWMIEDLPEGKKAIGCHWVYRLKIQLR